MDGFGVHINTNKTTKTPFRLILQVQHDCWHAGLTVLLVELKMGGRRQTGKDRGHVHRSYKGETTLKMDARIPF